MSWWSRRRQHRQFSYVFHDSYDHVVGPVPLDPHRASNVLAYVVQEKLATLTDVLTPRSASMRKLRLVHSDEHLGALTNPDTFAAVFGSSVSDDIAESVLQLQRTYVGGTILAVNEALRQNRDIVHLGGGLHHAHQERAHGFCLFNDVAIAVKNVRRKRDERRIAVVDLDYHDGDGTRACLADDAGVLNVSLHAIDFDGNRPANARAIALGTEVTAERYLAALHLALAEVTTFAPDLIIYVNGVDIAGDDAIGTWPLDTETVTARDVALFAMRDALPKKPPIVMLLSGGYGSGAWKHLAHSLAVLITGKTRRQPPSHLLAFARLAEKRERKDPMLDDTALAFSEEDVGMVSAPKPRKRFLGYYTPQMLEFSLERYGVLERLRGMGYGQPIIELTLGAPLGDTLRILNEPRREVLAEVTARRDSTIVPRYEVLYIEWLLLQHPRGSLFRALLPGQKHPGLGMSGEAIGLLVFVAQRLNLDGLAFTASQAHLVNIASRSMQFLDPAAAERFARGEFAPAVMVMPLSDGLRQKLQR